MNRLARKLKQVGDAVLELETLAEEEFLDRVRVVSRYFPRREVTVKMVDKALTSFPEKDWNFEYCSSW